MSATTGNNALSKKKEEMNRQNGHNIALASKLGYIRRRRIQESLLPLSGHFPSEADEFKKMRWPLILVAMHSCYVTKTDFRYRFSK